MKKLTLILALSLLYSMGYINITKAQTISDFEGLAISAGSYWNGSAQTLGTFFIDGNAIFPNYYDTAYGGFWKQGWAYSNMKDSSTAGFLNIYSARPACGALNSDNYAIGQQRSVVQLTGNAKGKAVYGLQVTNSTYAALSMRDGDLAKKFGGPTGNDPDWFKLSITGYLGGTPVYDTVNFYLADYRFPDNTSDYIVNDWQWVDLTSLGNLDSLRFILSSSDTGAFGMNTPAFFCIDNFTTADSPAGIDPHKNIVLDVFPNPPAELLHIANPEQGGELQIFDAAGQMIYRDTQCTGISCTIDLSNFAGGLYLIRMISDSIVHTARFIKTIR
jgi:hypothetical protein